MKEDSPIDDKTKFKMAMPIGIIVVILLAVIGRVYYLQTVQGDELQKKAIGQSSRTITLKARRGSIIDRNGTELAVSVQAPSIVVRPRAVKDREAVTQLLASVLKKPASKIRPKVFSSSGFVWIARQIDPEIADQIREKKLDGIEIHIENKRFYPQRSLGGQVVGFTNVDGMGIEGVERKYNKNLQGGEFEVTGMRDARGRTLMTNEAPKFNALEGETVQITLDERIQRVAESALKKQVEKFSAIGGFAVAMDVNTGEVLAMANTPEFDPNQFNTSSADIWRQRNVTDAMEPGSVIKPTLLAAAIDAKVTHAKKKYYCEKGRMKIGRRTIRDSHPNEMLSATEIVRESSNIGAYKIAQDLGRNDFYQYLRNFGFGERLSREVNGEQGGLIRKPKSWAEVTFANMAFGHGFSATPLQVTSAIATIANGGRLMRPKFIKKIMMANGKIVKESKPEMIRRVISENAAKDAIYAMALVPTLEGTAPRAALEYYTVAGKTGTAQKPNKDKTGYDPDGWIASFVGIAPAEDPQIVVLVMIDEPQKMHYGGVVAAPAFVEIMTEALAAKNVVPLPKDQRMQLPHPTIFDKTEKEIAALEKLTVEEGVINLDDETNTIDIYAEYKGPKTPSFIGLSQRLAIQGAEEKGLTTEVEGWGIVVKQIPEPNAPLPKDNHITILLRPPSRIHNGEGK